MHRLPPTPEAAFLGHSFCHGQFGPFSSAETENGLNPGHHPHPVAVQGQKRA